MKAEGRGSGQGSENTLAFTQDLFLLSGVCFLLSSLVLTCTACETLPDLPLSAVNSQKCQTLLLPLLASAVINRDAPNVKKI